MAARLAPRLSLAIPHPVGQGDPTNGFPFFVPVIGGVAGAAIGAISKATEGTGIGKDQLEKIRTEVTEGTSALFVVTDEGNLDRVGQRFHGMHSKLIDTNLTDAERRVLLDTFGGN
jgi:uncharacterized membrane protein